MLVPVALAIALSAAPVQKTAVWGAHEWQTGAGPVSLHYFETGTGFPSGYELENGTKAGSFHHLFFSVERGSSHFWDNGLEAGSAWFWRNGHEPGSRYYWLNGRDCLSDFGWRTGAVCTGGDILVFQTLCIARAVDLPPCEAINRRLEAWLARDAVLTTGGPLSEVVERMREVVE